jgi:cytoskeletal protein CcmA (bactofilin family)
MSFFGGRRQIEPAPASPPEVPPQIPPAAPQPFVGFETVLGANSTMDGTLKSGANVRLDGVFSGTLEITGNVLVGETARITADINAKNISIAGAVRGNVTGKKVQLLRTGRIWGDIRAQALMTEEGAFIDGKITMIGQEAPTEVVSIETSQVEEADEPHATLIVDDSIGERSPNEDESDETPAEKTDD